MLVKRWHTVESRLPQTVEDVVSILLRNRSVDLSFLNPSLAELEEHCNCCGMAEGAELLASHLKQGRKVVLVGDYDCDGVTSAAQMALFLREIGHPHVATVLPERSEGYGFPLRAVSDHPDAGVFVAMDCGTHDFQAILAARRQGADCIVIDHHEIGAQGVAAANVLINPKQPGCPSRFKELCASGLTLLFLTRLRRALAGTFPSPRLGGKFLALAAIGTIADLVPLVDGNRIIAKSGLRALNTDPYPPLARIADTAGLTGRILNAGHVGFQLAPRLNAAGRMASPRLAFDLLMAEDPAELGRAANELHGLNRRRQQQEEAILQEIAARFGGSLNGRRTVVLADVAWPLGLLGIVASRVQQELLYGPSVILSLDREMGLARGSARSVGGFDLHEALGKTEHLLVKWGGHKMAAGLTVQADKLDAFADALEEIAQAHPADTFVPSGRVDVSLPPDLIDEALLDALEHLEPHGPGNAKPMFVLEGVRVSVPRRFGRDQVHLSMIVNDRLKAVFWRGALHPGASCLCSGHPVDLVFQLERDRRTLAPLLNVKHCGDSSPG